MKRLSLEQQIDIVSLLSSDSSVRDTARRVGVHQDSVSRFDLMMGDGCAKLHDRLMRNLQVSRVEMDEQWSFIKKKQKRVVLGDPDEVGDCWLYVAFAPVEKTYISYLIGKRTAENTNRFMLDLRSRIVNRFQLTSDGYSAYIDAVDLAFEGDVDYGQVVKTYRVGKVREEHPFIKKMIVFGNPEPKRISTSLVERANLTNRMQLRRFTRRVNAHSKKLRNHVAAVSRWIAFYNFCRVHQTLRTSPAVALNVTDHVWSIEELIREALGSNLLPNPEMPISGPVSEIASAAL
jgi:IS1 family transposase